MAFIIVACALSRNAIVETPSNEESDAIFDADAPIDGAAAAAGGGGGARSHERTHASRPKATTAAAAGGGGGGDRGSNPGNKKSDGNRQ